MVSPAPGVVAIRGMLQVAHYDVPCRLSEVSSQFVYGMRISFPINELTQVGDAHELERTCEIASGGCRHS